VIVVWDEYVPRFLSQAVESVLDQDEPARIVVVDNASTVPVDARPGVDLIHTPERLTVGGARNFGLAVVDTEAVMLWDADDVMLPGTLRRLRERLEAGPAVVAVSAGILEAPGIQHHWPRPVGRLLARRRRALALAQAVSSQFPTTGAVLMRTAAVKDARGFADAQGGDDWVLGVSLAFRGRVVFDPRPGRLYRQHPGSVTSAWRFFPHQLTHMRQVRERVRTDPATPRWLRFAAPALAPLQLAATLLVGPVARLGAVARGKRRIP
jgi:glycosyltransferase involved in cell wall biosynthesis